MLAKSILGVAPVDVGIGIVGVEAERPSVGVYCRPVIGLPAEEIADREPSLSLNLIVRSFRDISYGTPLFYGFIDFSPFLKQDSIGNCPVYQGRFGVILDILRGLAGLIRVLPGTLSGQSF